MDSSTIIGIIVAFAVFILATTFSFVESSVLLDNRAVLIVVGGTVAASMIAFPFSDFRKLFRVFVRRLMGKSRADYQNIINEIKYLSKVDVDNKRAFEKAAEEITHPFLKDAAKVLFWIRADVSAEELRSLLETRAETHYKEYMREANFFRIVSKFPPSFGLMGTTMGMIALLQGLGNSQNLRETIGPAMAVALLTTLYGLVLSNFFLIPIAENLIDQTYEDQKARKMIIEGIMLIQAKKPARYVEEHVKSYLLPSQRTDNAS